MKISSVGPTKSMARLIMLNDVYTLSRSDNDCGGLSAAASLIKELRNDCISSGVDCLFFISGDFAGGSNLSVMTNGEIVIDILNEIGVDAVCIGNHEMDYGWEQLEKLIERSRFGCWLGGNIVKTDALGTGAKPILLKGCKAWHVFELPNSGARIGVLGVCTCATPVLSHPGPGVEFLDLIPVVQQSLLSMHAEVNDINFVVALTHVSVADDREILNKCRGIDLVLGGHDHDPMAFLVNDSLLFKSGQNASHVGVVDVCTNTKDLSWSMISTANFFEDPECLRILKDFDESYKSENAEIASQLHRNMVHLSNPLSSKSHSVRTRETSCGNFLADAMFEYSKKCGVTPDLAMINGGFIRGDRLYDAGTNLTFNDILTEFPFPRDCRCLEIFGEYLTAALEQQLRALPSPSGSFPHFSDGVELRFDASREPLSRIVSFCIRGIPVVSNRKYLLITSDFISTGGDGCSFFCFGVPNTKVAPKRISDIAVLYLEDRLIICPSTSGRCVEVTQ